MFLTNDICPPLLYFGLLFFFLTGQNNCGSDYVVSKALEKACGLKFKIHCPFTR